MDQVQDQAQEALFTAIKNAVENDVPKASNIRVRTESLAELALAYRYAAGGPQPGSVTVEK